VIAYAAQLYLDPFSSRRRAVAKQTGFTRAGRSDSADGNADRRRCANEDPHRLSF